MVAEKGLGFWWYWESHCDMYIFVCCLRFEIQLTKNSWKTSFYTSFTGLLAEYLRPLLNGFRVLIRPEPGINIISDTI